MSMVILNIMKDWFNLGNDLHETYGIDGFDEGEPYTIGSFEIAPEDAMRFVNRNVDVNEILDGLSTCGCRVIKRPIKGME